MRVSIKSTSNRDRYREIEIKKLGDMIYECENDKLKNMINSLYHVLI